MEKGSRDQGGPPRIHAHTGLMSQALRKVCPVEGVPWG